MKLKKKHLVSTKTQIKNLIESLFTPVKPTQSRYTSENFKYRSVAKYRKDANCARTATHRIAKGKPTRRLSGFTSFAKPKTLSPRVLKNERF